MIDSSEIKAKLYEWADSIVTPARVIWMDQNAPRPDLSYIGLKILTASTYGMSQRLHTEVNGDFENVQDIDFTLNVQGYGDQAFTLVGNLWRSFDLVVNRDLLAEANVSVYDVGAVSDLTSIIGTGYERRAGFDMFCNAEQVQSETLSWIETVEIDRA